jgi:hypothetical protein
MAQYVPPDWPVGVHPPGSEGWEGTAVTWLLDLMPEYRQYATVCRHPVILASIARHLLRGSVDGASDGYRTVRTELAGHALPHAADAALTAYRTEGRRLAAAARAVDLVEHAPRGEVLNPGSDRPLTRSFHVLRPTAAFLVRAGFLVSWIPLDVCGFHSVLARGWHDLNGLVLVVDTTDKLG